MNRLGQDGPHEIKNHPWLKNYPWDKLYNKELESPFIPNVFFFKREIVKIIQLGK